MMTILNNPAPNQWNVLCERPQFELEYLDTSVRNILNRVRTAGDDAIRALTQQYDGVSINTLTVSEEEIKQAIQAVPADLREAIQTAASNIRTFHASQQLETTFIETMPGVTCWRKRVPIRRVGIYIPGGSAPLFSTVLMLAIPASLAGCSEIILCTPPDKNGLVNSAILYAASITGVTRIYKVGGAQAIAALAYGTQSIPAVDKIFGPGNQFVTKAKQLVSQEGVAIDLPAGPSEVMVLADASATPAFVAADLLSQAEHGPDSQVVLVLTDASLYEPIAAALEAQLKTLPRRTIAEQALANSRVIAFGDPAQRIAFVNQYAPEHLIINTRDADDLAEAITQAGSVFIGNLTPEAAGDYASGTNHTLPTNGYARAYSGVSLESFCKTITFQKITEAGLRTLGPVIEKMAAAEQLEAHKQAVSIRLQTLA